VKYPTFCQQRGRLVKYPAFYHLSFGEISYFLSTTRALGEISCFLSTIILFLWLILKSGILMAFGVDWSSTGLVWTLSYFIACFQLWGFRVWPAALGCWRRECLLIEPPTSHSIPELLLQCERLRRDQSKRVACGLRMLIQMQMRGYQKEVT
jgi:hypothetical protein